MLVSAATRWRAPRSTAAEPFPAGPAPGRLERDVLTLSGVTSVIWLEGINDFSRNGNASVEAVQDADEGVVAACGEFAARLIGATVTSALNAPTPAHGSAEPGQKRKALNAFIRTGDI